MVNSNISPIEARNAKIPDSIKIPECFLDIYNLSREVPIEAQKAFNNGRFSGTDINPMWRIKKLTELFGPCGFGWYYEIVKVWLEEGSESTKTSNVIINLYININGEWSKPIPGIGGNLFISKTSKGLTTSDECHKMALTDAISVAAKQLGIGADIYFSGDRTKYSQTSSEAPKTKTDDSELNWWSINN